MDERDKLLANLEHIQPAHSLRDLIEIISSKRESGRLEIKASANTGAFFFKEGELLDARLGSLTGFQAVNAALSVRHARFAFDPSSPMPISSSITPNERVVLKQFFGIECVEPHESCGLPVVDWDVTPAAVVPLSEVRRRHVALYLAAVLIFSAAVIGLALKVNGRREQASVAETTAFPSAAISEQTGTAAPAPSVREAGSAVPQQESKPGRTEPSPPVVTAQQTNQHQQELEQNLTGEWRIVNTVEKTAYRQFDNLEIGFRLVISQTGKEFTAKGEKISENGRTLAAGDRTPIQVSGSINGDKVVASFVENGAMRKTNGRFVWRIQSAGAGLTGTFMSTAARSSGKSSATKEL